jgi:predicted nucleic acid-binding protein
MTQLADTNIVAELVRKRPDSGVVAWAGRATSVALSVVSVEEVYFGLSWHRNDRVLDWFERFLDLHCEVLPITGVIAHRAGWLRGELRRRGQTRTQADMLIAASAQVHGLTLVTRNERDFRGCGIPILNPFRE